VNRMAFPACFVLRTLVLIAITGTLLLAACAPGSTRQAKGPRDDCGLIEPTASDVKIALSFGSQAFTSDDWVKSYTVEPYKITLHRNNSKLDALSYLEYLVYNCGYGQADLDGYFNDEGFDIIFSAYDSHELTQFCEQTSLALYEYDLIENGTPYAARYWVKQAEETRLLVYMLVFPKSNPDALETYSRMIFPDFTTCA
jgi:hypothetical protein